MKCPKCGYTSFDYLYNCNKCEKDLTGHKKTFNISEDKSGFINILKYVELENSPEKEYPLTEEETEEITDSDEPGRGEEITFELEEEAEVAASPYLETLAPDTSDSAAGLETLPDLTEEPEAEEVQLEEVNITMDDFDTPEEKIEPEEISFDGLDKLKPEGESKEEGEPELLPIDEIDLSEVAIDEASQVEEDEVPESPEEEIEGLEISLDLEDSGEEQKSEEIEFSIDSINKDEGVEEPQVIEHGEPEVSISLDEEEATSESSGKTAPTTEERGEEEISAVELTEEPRVESDTPSVTYEEIEPVPEPVTTPEETGLDFSFDSKDSHPDKTDSRSERLVASEDDLELSLDEFDNFNIDMEDFDLTGDVPKVDKATGSDTRDRKRDEESKTKSEDKSSDNHSLDIDLDDLYQD